MLYNIHKGNLILQLNQLKNQLYMVKNRRDHACLLIQTQSRFENP